uniref:Uncharacterized protein n=1 Tax=Helicotheca tamesis TaxID=374047 RepID=A0A7S2IA07_9STRA|mmetsp:Transcript_7225/g.9804  ORF Transcript_7225/g.9804 Transcript_7225/m.9804 type:complete len:268 (+) Transcript_7225:83-886(+)|eukprot:CAMPEP_0185732236 /NCGR_PEP_ID=MMETSP1171-20130828/15476_1 /TAXON_ID=374046 /ORGANISM="Helicotheca tamensis, Strain CCMP826" /LENGTH=267 /DNA_ID=CAMNT_0028401679 /DNA_START=43 /DNA_END=846 /DNA_ORIENTATION=-
MSAPKYDAIPSAAPIAETAVTMVEVVAPATLSGGFQFDAVYNGQTFPVTVPPEGVTQGQKFTVPFTVVEATVIHGTADSSPLRRWKDGLCDCCKYGCCHPHFLCAWCFPALLMGQVLTRMKMSWCGNYASESEWRSTYRYIIYTFIAYVVISSLTAPPPPEYEYINDELVNVAPDGPLWQSIVYNITNAAFGLYTLFVLIKLRRAVREKDEIPEKRCKGCEDCCCVFWCGCCTVAQLARQTADYDVQEATCCSDTGLKFSPTTVMVV